MKRWLKRHLPGAVVDAIDSALFSVRRLAVWETLRFFRIFGLNVVKSGDYYSTLPVLSELRKNQSRWDRPSALPGLNIDYDRMRSLLEVLHDRWQADFGANAGNYIENVSAGFGPGYPRFDARVLYYLLRDTKPARYLEVGSGLSTYYASLAAAQNAKDGKPMQITCIEPYPFAALKTVDGINIIQDFAQNVSPGTFEQLEGGDVLFIDSSHSLKIDSDVAYLFLEILPRLNDGVIIHIHDVPFPYNTPFPSKTWLFGERWPVYWNEAMIVQAFLAFNSRFEIILSAPALRHADEEYFIGRFSDYTPLSGEPNPFSSLWIRTMPTSTHRH